MLREEGKWGAKVGKRTKRGNGECGHAMHRVLYLFSGQWKGQAFITILGIKARDSLRLGHASSTVIFPLLMERFGH